MSKKKSRLMTAQNMRDFFYHVIAGSFLLVSFIGLSYLTKNYIKFPLYTFVDFVVLILLLFFIFNLGWTAIFAFAIGIAQIRENVPKWAK